MAEGDAIRGAPMEKILATHHFGPHRVDVVEDVDDDGRENFAVLVDDRVVTTSPLDQAPTMEEVVRIYSEWQSASD
jgi:hypothetical protein